MQRSRLAGACAGPKRIILLAGAAVVLLTACQAQTYDYFIMPQHTDTFWAYCPLTPYNCPIEMRTGWYAYTNAHYHLNPTPPWSTMQCVKWQNYCSPTSGQQIVGNTTWLGSIEVRILTTLVGQAESFYISTGGPWNYKNYVVGYSDVYYNNHEEIWLRVGGDDTGPGTGHGSTHYTAT